MSLEQWGLPIVSVVGVATWSVVVWSTRGHPAAELTLIIFSAAMALFVSSLAGAGVIDAISARTALGIERVILALTGIYGVFWAFRYWRDGST